MSVFTSSTTARMRSALALALAIMALSACGSSTPAKKTADIELPPVGAAWDYQIGGAYTPPKGVEIVSRDRADDPAPGLYNVCYVNAFQTQPDEKWPSRLLLHDAKGKVVEDPEWDGESVLDITTRAKREEAAERVGAWFEECAEKGFDAVEPDNLDTFTRWPGLLTADQATAYVSLLSKRAHALGLAIAQKNTGPLASRRAATGLDFAVVEECGRYDECGAFAKPYRDRVVVVEYEDEGMARACDGFGDRLSVVRRDQDVSTPDDDGYVREVC
ncbi:endo alpha-1,4 polygalactosaminidase [Streptomyces sp. NPDC021098]|uniref:endo alpha-1,4 polygalactosaminidase n=1 Tax=unclassified Streptomyces TaxID=2593676 RepID=UPI00378E9070